MNELEPTIQNIEVMSRSIWDMDQEPQAVAALKKKRFTPSGTVPSVLYACFDVANGSSYLVIARDMLQDPQNGLKECAALLHKFFSGMAGRYATWGLEDIADQLRAALKGLGDVADRDVLLRLVEALLVYNNKLWNRLDMCIPWFELDENVQLR